MTVDPILRANSPRYTPEPTPWPSLLIHAGVAALWVVLFAGAFVFSGVFAWSVGLIYVAYDTVLLGFTFVQTWALRRVAPVAIPSAPATLAVIVAAHNEAAVLPVTLAALFAQSAPADLVVIADDGSSDGTAEVLARDFGLTPPPLGTLSARSATHPLVWLRLPHGGKAAALNAALAAIDSEVVLTVDADTLLEPTALAAIRAAFVADAEPRRGDGCADAGLRPLADRRAVRVVPAL